MADSVYNVKITNDSGVVFDDPVVAQSPNEACVLAFNILSKPYRKKLLAMKAPGIVIKTWMMGSVRKSIHKVGDSSYILKLDPITFNFKADASHHILS